MSYQDMVSKIYKQSAWVIFIMTSASIFLTDWRFAFNLMLGGAAAVFNLRGIVWAVQTLLGTDKAQTKMLFLSFFRLIVLATFFIVLGIFKILHPYALLIGFSIVFIIIVKEGLMTAYRIKKQEMQNA